MNKIKEMLERPIQACYRDANQHLFHFSFEKLFYFYQMLHWCMCFCWPISIIFEKKVICSPLMSLCLFRHPISGGSVIPKLPYWSYCSILCFTSWETAASHWDKAGQSDFIYVWNVEWQLMGQEAAAWRRPCSIFDEVFRVGFILSI